MNSTKDISIGINKWIKWVEFDPTDDNAILEIDDLLTPSFKFWDGLETLCLAECCGIEAFAFWEENVTKASDEIDKTQLVTTLRNARAELILSPKAVVLSSKLNNLLDKNVFIELLDHIVTTIEGRQME